MKRYTFAFLRDYFSARGLTLEKWSHCDYQGRRGYTLTNGHTVERFYSLDEVRARALRGAYPNA